MRQPRGDQLGQREMHDRFPIDFCEREFALGQRAGSNGEYRLRRRRWTNIPPGQALQCLRGLSRHIAMLHCADERQGHAPLLNRRSLEHTKPG